MQENEKRDGKTGKIHSNKHHIIPTSRGGPKNGWNKRSVNKEKHSNLHTLFANLLPDEMILIIEQSWAGENGALKEEILSHDQIKAWYRLFGTNQTSRAVNIIRSEWNLSQEEKEEWEKWKSRRKGKIIKFVKKTRKTEERR